MNRPAGVILLLAAIPLAGCRPGAPRRPLQDRDPVFVIPAVKEVAQERPGRVEAAKVRRAVELLDSEDSAIRLSAEHALQELSGGLDFGYRFWADAEDRAEAVARWRTWAEARYE